MINQDKDHKKTHAKKIIAAVAVTILVLAYWGVWLVLLATTTTERSPWMILLGVVILAMAGGLIYVLIQRIREIRKGEEDDLSQY